MRTTAETRKMRENLLICSVLLNVILFIICLFFLWIHRSGIKRRILNIFSPLTSQTSTEEKMVSSEAKVDNSGIDKFLDCGVRPNSVLCMELIDSHHECLPGAVKHFLDLGYNVDILATERGESAFLFFENDDGRYVYYPYSFESMDYLLEHCDKFQEKIKNYDYLYLNTFHEWDLATYERLGIYRLNNIVFQIHDTAQAANWIPKTFFDRNRLTTLADFGVVNFVNMNYFGKIETKPKNKITKIFMTSTLGRNYQPLLSAVKTLKEEGIEVLVEITGRYDTFMEKDVPEDLRENFIFHNQNGEISYEDMYKIVVDCDFVFIPLDSNSERDVRFKTTGSSGSVQLSYGFLKPLILNRDFASTYKLDDSSAVLYENSGGLLNAMRLAATMNQNKYSKLQEKLKTVVGKINMISLENLRKIINQ